MTTAPAAAPPIMHALDHVVVAVRDLDAAVAAYRALLGRAPAWRAEAHGGGATVVTFALANVAVELMAPSGMGATAERLTAVLDAQGEGLASLAFATGDIERAHRRLARLGLGPEPITDGGEHRRRDRRAPALAPHARGHRGHPRRPPLLPAAGAAAASRLLARSPPR